MGALEKWGVNTRSPSRAIMLPGHFCKGETEARCSTVTPPTPLGDLGELECAAMPAKSTKKENPTKQGR